LREEPVPTTSPTYTRRCPFASSACRASKVEGLCEGLWFELQVSPVGQGIWVEGLGLRGQG
jgi:hypothetical protein